MNDRCWFRNSLSCPWLQRKKILIFSIRNYSSSNVDKTGFVRLQWHRLLTPGRSFGLRHSTTDAKQSVRSDAKNQKEKILRIQCTRNKTFGNVMFEPTLGNWPIRPMQFLNPNTKMRPAKQRYQCKPWIHTHEKKTSNSELELHLSAGSMKSKCQTVNLNAKPCYQTAKQSNKKKVPPKLKIIQRAPIGANFSGIMCNPVLCAQRNVASERASLTLTPIPWNQNTEQIKMPIKHALQKCPNKHPPKMPCAKLRVEQWAFWMI